MSWIFFSRLHLFDLFFSIDRVEDVLKMFEPNEARATIRSAESRTGPIAMFEDPTTDAVGNSAVKDMSSAGYEIDVIVVVALAQRRSLHFASLRSG